MAFSARASHDAISNINITPLVDVLLVLLIIFMITVPVITHKAGIDLPLPSTAPPTARPDPIHLAVQSDGSLSWNRVPISAAQLEVQLNIAARQATQPELQIQAADGVAYDAVAQVLATAKAQGVAKIDFIGNTD